MELSSGSLKNNSKTSFLSGGGEMGTLIQSFDWTSTSIGPIDNWPQSLRTTLGILVNSKFPMFLFWGPDLLCFYNDAYRPSLGNEGKHPLALGAPGAMVWPEIWADIKPLIDQVLSGGEASWSENQLLPIYRNGHMEDVYWTFSYSPVYDEDGIGGVYVTCTETTTMVKSVEKLKSSDHRFKTLVRDANVGIVILQGRELRIDLVNKIYAKLINHTPEEIIDRPLFDVIPDAETYFGPLLHSVMTDGKPIEISSVPYSVTTKGVLTEGFLDVVYQPYREEDGVITGVIATCHDVTQTVRTREKLEASESYFRQVTDTVPAIIWITDSDGNCTYLNKHWYDRTGQGKEEALGLGWLNATHPDDLAETGKAFLEANEKQESFYALYRLRNKSGEYRWAVDSGSPKFSPDGKYEGMIGTVVDVHDQQTAEMKIRASEHLLSTVIEESPVRISFLTGPELIVTLINDTITKSWGKDRSVIGKPLATVLPELESQPFLKILRSVYETGQAYHATESEVIFAHASSKLYFDIWYKPVLDSAGNVYGILTSAIDVTDRVATKKQNLETERRFKDVVESAPFPIGVYVGTELRILLANQTILDTWGKGNDVVGKLYTEILPELDNQPIFEQIRGVLETGIPFHAKNTRVDLFIDGTLNPYYFNYSFTPLFDSSGQVYGVMNTAADVTDINLANQKIEQSEQRFRSLIEAAPVAIGVFMGRDLLVETHNQAFIDIVGKGPDIIGKPLRELMPELETENQPFLQILDNIFTTGKMFEAYGAQVKIIQNGIMTYNYYDITYTPLFNSDGEVYAILDIAIDVTENTIVQQKIEENEKNLRNTILQAPVAMCILRGSNHFVEIANERMLELWGKKHEEIVGKKLMDGLMELKGQGFDLLLDRVYETGETYKAYDVSVNLPRENGIETVYVDFVYEAFKEIDGRISGILVVASDVTEQMFARKKIQQAEESARLAIESADLGAYEIDLSNDEMNTSERFNEIWGVPRTGFRNDFAKHVHPDDVKNRVKAHSDALDTGNLHYEARVIREDRSQVWVRVKGKVLYNENGTPKTLLGVIQDITEQKEFAEELSKQVKQRTLELNRSNEDLLHFAHIASHDLKEPVRKIKVFSNMLEEQFSEFLPEKGKLYIDKVQNATDRMFSMIEGILTYSAVNASDQPIEKVDINEIIGSIETDLEILIQQKKATIISDNLPVIEGASILIYQLFYNLINNALKFAKTDIHPVIQIHSSIISRNDVDYAEISLADNGIGIDQEYAEQIFTAFTRLNAKDKYEGTGLGLALCKKITDRHHGSITATGIRDEGAVFTILLPLRQSQKIL